MNHLMNCVQPVATSRRLASAHCGCPRPHKRLTPTRAGADDKNVAPRLSPRLVVHPWGAATFGLAAASLACDRWVDVSLPAAAAQLVGGGEASGGLACLAAAAGLPLLLAPAQRAAQARWRAHGQDRAAAAVNIARPPSAPTEGASVAGRRLPRLGDGLEVAADLGEALGPLLIQACALAFPLDNAGRLSLAVGAAAWGAGLLWWSHPHMRGTGGLERASDAAGRVAALSPLAAGLLAVWQATGAGVAAPGGVAATLAASLDGVGLACPAIIITALLSRPAAEASALAKAESCPAKTRVGRRRAPQP